MRAIDRLQQATSLRDLAHILGYKPSSLAYIVYRIPDSQKYRSFNIPKARGGTRTIYAPTEKLKLLQRHLANLLYQCDDTQTTHDIAHPSINHGFRKRHSIFTNADIHKRRRYVLNIDLLDFFPSCNFGRVYGFFKSDSRFRLDDKVSRIIAQIACYNNHLPQGSPCSPVISNYIAHVMDVRLLKLAKSAGCMYSRYADDITFSTNRKDFPTTISCQCEDADGEWSLSSTLISEVERSGFAINNEKTRMQVRGSRQEVTGLIVNQKPNIDERYYREVRAMCHNLFNTGTYHVKRPATYEGGSPTECNIMKEMQTLDVLQGKLSHIYRIKSQADCRKWSWKNKDEEPPYAAYTLYKKFLFYKNFMVADKPIIVPEGKTDARYLKIAISQSHDKYTELIDIDEEGKPRYKVSFMNYTKTVRDILELGRGTGDLVNLINMYKPYLDSMKGRTLTHPVIILVDNDAGADKVLNIVRQKTKKELVRSSQDNFYHIYGNLYIVKTPEYINTGSADSCIEDLLPQWVRQVKVGGKDFDTDKTHEDHSKFGKEILSKEVVAKRSAEIDFSGFHLLLNRICEVINDYAQHHTQRLENIKE